MSPPPYSLREPPQGGAVSGLAEPVPRRPLEGRPSAWRSWLVGGVLSVLVGVAFAGEWQASGSDQVKVSHRQQGDQHCLDYDFNGVSGYAVLRRAWPQDWPANFALHTRLSGHGAGNELQLKLVDASGDNVWWVTRPGFVPAALPEPTVFKQRQVQFAWGPVADRTLRRTQALEWVVVATAGGARQGSLCVDALQLQPGMPVADRLAAPRLSPQAGLLDLDLHALSELAGLRMEWPQAPGRYTIEASADGNRWQSLRTVQRPLAGPDLQFLGELEARWLRLRFDARIPTPTVQLRSLQDWPSRDAMLAELARLLPEGDLPRAYRGQQNYWTLVGVDGGATASGLLSEDGALELRPGGPSLEPALRLQDGRLVTWAQVERSHSLRGGHLPLPQVHWRHPEVQLDIEAGADREGAAPGRMSLLASYRVRNLSPQRQRLSLLLTLRPWQVNPPQQFLNLRGGLSPLPTLHWDGLTLRYPAATTPPATAEVFALPLPSSVHALPLDAGSSLRALLAAPAWQPGPREQQDLRSLLEGHGPKPTPAQTLTDPVGLASAVMRFDLDLPPGGEERIGIQTRPGIRLPERRLELAAEQWRRQLGKLDLNLPPAAGPLADRMRAALAQILISRDGPWLRPGTRSYARSWIRDGAMMVAALLRMGEVTAAREFVDAYQGILFDSGKVPCCHDARGADPVVENDSHGQYLYAVAEVWRHTQDADFLARHWPAVQRTVAYIDHLRQSERTATNQTPERARFFGLMPPSISHEGYSDKPAYAYWDNFWTLRGLKDAVQMARAQQSPLATSYATQLAEFEHDLSASIRATAQHYGQAVIAGAADRGDYDPTSTTVLLNPAQGEALVAPALLAGTFERYLHEARERAAGTRPYKDYTPYELRNVSALVRLGQADAAHELLAFFYKDARPQGWHQWAEVVLPDAREPRFLGDMPHAWISADFLRAALDLFAYERGADLVLGAGLTAAWRASGPVRIAGLSTAFGRLDYRLQPTPSGWQLHIDHRPERLPGQLRLAWPGTNPLPRATADGQPLPWDGRELPLPATHATIDLVTP